MVFKQAARYRKFIMGVASAAQVATAVAPVVSVKESGHRKTRGLEKSRIKDNKIERVEDSSHKGQETY